MTKEEARDIIESLKQEVERLVDSGQPYQNELWHIVCTIRHIQKTYNQPYHNPNQMTLWPHL